MGEGSPLRGVALYRSGEGKDFRVGSAPVLTGQGRLITGVSPCDLLPSVMSSTTVERRDLRLIVHKA